jgi:membrane-bound ClpP family serine protease
LTTSTDKDGTGTVISYQGYELLFGGKTPLFLTAFILIAAAMVCFVVSFFVLRKNQKAGFYTLLGATIVSFLGTVFYLVGKNANSFESSLYINLSYGFILCAAFALAASVFGLIYLRDTKKLEKAASNEETPKKEEVSHEAN